MKLNPLLAALLTGAGALASGAAHAGATSWDPSWAFSGFGTIGYTRTSTDEGQFANPGQYGGVKKDGGFTTDTLLGAQVNAKANDVFSATVQGIAVRNGKGTYQPQLEWAFVKAQVTPELSLRAGRMGTPFFMVSDYRHVNYSNLWVRPPVDVYGQVPVSHFDGGDLTYRTSIGSANITAQIYDGQSKAWVTGTHIVVGDQMGITVSAEFDYGITLRAGTSKGKITFGDPPLNGLPAMLSQTPFASVGSQLVGDHVSFSGVGASIDHENYVGNVEYTVRRSNNFVPDTTGWEVTGGYRIGKFTPFLTVSKVKIDDTNVVNNIPTATQQLAMLHGIVDGVLFGTSDSEHSEAVGLRWDVHQNIALKAQFDRIHVTPGSSGTFQKATAALSQKAVNVFAVSCDFVF